MNAIAGGSYGSRWIGVSTPQLDKITSEENAPMNPPIKKLAPALSVAAAIAAATLRAGASFLIGGFMGAFSSEVILSS